MPKDIFASVPEFLAAFNNILENGFFEGVQFHVGGSMMEGKIHNCSVTVSGCVPSDNKYMVGGCGVIIDPNSIIASCRALVGKMKVKDVSTKVETKDWPLWNTQTDTVAGSKGKRTELYLLITFKA